ncbi:MAG: winged helix-turn-helix transcriptional regulator [Candidatus Bathyarchaeia archaeon]|jgi:predicted transcriptional regulator
MVADDELKKWLETRFTKIDQRIGKLEQAIAQSKQPKIRIAWYRTLLGMTELGGKAGTEKLADHLGISRSVISEYLNRMEEEGIVKRDFNEDTRETARYIWQIDWESLPPEIASRLRKK